MVKIEHYHYYFLQMQKEKEDDDIPEDEYETQIKVCSIIEKVIGYNEFQQCICRTL